ncbi:AEC family transporter [Breznakiella homolactica]|uniref:AEC family transporter n=1 Tax=Breznakiella homolactica TaxID=2798577 RepID=A0A7T7XQF2_9SPIR|nr:AEC family transporter [Breznakiella homolactica]QQO10600.1 AEC family transporter [Breznakiella homolactica]
MNVAGHVAVLFILIVIGYLAAKLKAVDAAASGHFSSFIIKVSLPCVIFISFQKPFSMELLGEAGLALGVSLVIYGISFALAAFYPNLLRLKGGERGVHRYAVVFSNVGFMGYPVVEVILGPAYLFHLSMYNVPFNLFAYSIGAWLIARESERPLQLSWRTFINPCVIATILGFACFLLSVSMPGPLYRSLSMIGDITSPLSMVVIGITLAQADIRKVLGRWQNYVTVLVRLILLPAAIGGILYALGIRGHLLMLSVIITAMPVAANTSIFASFYGTNAEDASSLVFLSTLLCIGTIPLTVFVLNALG